MITATYSDGSTQVITDYTITNGTNMEDGQDNIKIKYTEGDVTVYTTTPITVGDSATGSTDTTTTATKAKNTAAAVVTSVMTNDSTPIFMTVIILIVALTILVILKIKKKKE